MVVVVVVLVALLLLLLPLIPCCFSTKENAELNCTRNDAPQRGTSHV